MYNKSWRDNQPSQEIEEISLAKCLLGAASIVALFLVGVALVVVALSL